MKPHKPVFTIFLAALPTLSGCATACYRVLEKLALKNALERSREPNPVHDLLCSSNEVLVPQSDSVWERCFRDRLRD